MLAWVFLFQQTAFVTTSIGSHFPTPTFSFKLFAVGWLIELFHCQKGLWYGLTARLAASSLKFWT